MVLRIITLFIGLTSFVNAQNLFFTDSYRTNLYEHNENVFILNNNIFALLNDSTSKQLESLINDYFEKINLNVQKVESNIPTQIRYTYNSEKFKPLNWSKIWHQEYGLDFSAILLNFTQSYFNKAIDIPKDIYQASILKHAYYNQKTHNDRTSDFSKTTLQITSSSVVEADFRKAHLDPNFSLNRIVTKSFGNYYNESYPIKELENEKIFVFGPSNKARLKDCLSLLYYEKINPNSQIIYLKSNSVLVLDSLASIPFTNEHLKFYKGLLRSKILQDVNSLDICFYNIDDKRNITKLFEEYKVEDYEEFFKIYLQLNSYNLAKPLDKIDETYNNLILQSKVFFKVNDTSFVTTSQKNILNSLAQFLSNNKIEQILIIGYAGKTEYERIDKKAYNSILEKYKDFPPVEASKTPDLSIFRAVTIFDYLVDQGVPPSSMSCLSMIIDGEELRDYAFAKFVVR